MRKTVCLYTVHVFVLKHELCLPVTQDLCTTALHRSQFLWPFLPSLPLPVPIPPLPHPEKNTKPFQPFLHCNTAVLWLPSPDKTVKLWKVSERDKRPEGYNLKDEEGRLRDPATITTLRVSPVAGFCHCLCASLAARVKGRAPWVGPMLAAV